MSDVKTYTMTLFNLYSKKLGTRVRDPILSASMALVWSLIQYMSTTAQESTVSPNHLYPCPQNALHSPQTPPPPLNLLVSSPYHHSLSIHTPAAIFHMYPSHPSLTRFLLLMSNLHYLSQLFVICN